MSVAAIVVHWSSLEDLPSCLSALGTLPELEVVVVDNASPDGGEELIRRQYPVVRWLAMGRNAGFGAAVNAGAASTGSDWILALNPDTAVSGEEVLRLAQAAHDLGAAAIGPRILGPRGLVERSYGTRDSLWGDLLWMAAWRGGRAVKSAQSPREVAWVTGACLLVRREPFERVGGFDEGYFLYFEDADLCRRLRREGGRVIYHPGFSAAHRRGGSARGGEEGRELAYRRSQMRFASLHRTAGAQRLIQWSLELRAFLWRAPWSRPELKRRGAALHEILSGAAARE